MVARLLFTAFLLASLLGFIAALRERVYPGARRPWRADLAAFGCLWLLLVGVDRVIGFSDLGIQGIGSEANIRGSESFSLALGLAAAVAATLLRADPRSASFRENVGLACLFLPAAVVLLGLSKVSLVPVVLAVLGYLCPALACSGGHPFWPRRASAWPWPSGWWLRAAPASAGPSSRPRSPASPCWRASRRRRARA